VRSLLSSCAAWKIRASARRVAPMSVPKCNTALVMNANDGEGLSIASSIEMFLSFLLCSANTIDP
jgi:hypothetical protein